MPSWLFTSDDLKATPSVNSMSHETEQSMRREGTRLIIDVGGDLNLRCDTVATACVYFHRFFTRHSFVEFDRYVAAIGCLFLAGKVEETPKKCRDLLKVARTKFTDQQFKAFGDDPREQVMAVERVLLQTIKFDLQVNHPYQFLLRYAKSLKGDKTNIEQMIQMAWTFVNDSLCTTLCLQQEPEIIAIALMHLAGRLKKFPFNDWHNRRGIEGEKWWDQFVEDLTIELLEDICHQVLDLYSAHTGHSAMPSSMAAPNVRSSATNSETTSPIGHSQSMPTTPLPSSTLSNGTPLSQPLIRRDSTKLPPMTSSSSTACAMQSLPSTNFVDTSHYPAAALTKVPPPLIPGGHVPTSCSLPQSLAYASTLPGNHQHAPVSRGISVASQPHVFGEYHQLAPFPTQRLAAPSLEYGFGPRTHEPFDKSYSTNQAFDYENFGQQTGPVAVEHYSSIPTRVGVPLSLSQRTLSNIPSAASLTLTHPAYNGLARPPTSAELGQPRNLNSTTPFRAPAIGVFSSQQQQQRFQQQLAPNRHSHQSGSVKRKYI